VRAGIERGIQYFFWTPLRTGAVTPVLREALARDRERYVVAAGPSMGYFAGSVRRGLERALRTLGTEYVDVLQLFWVGVGSAFTDATVGELVRLKEEGKARAIGISIHNRERAGRLVVDSPIDVFMLRYNAAHPGAERDVFPCLEKRRPAVVAYTATSWRKLLKAPRGWQGRVPGAADCYRFCLSSPHVDVVLTGPKTGAELMENLDGLARGALAPEEDRFMREFGHAVHG
jgi:aryl-alcohol dehydrogenase-like predicted oxidoreductase